MLCLHFSRESTLVGRRIHSPVLQMQSIEPTKTHIWLRFLRVLASSSSVAGLSSAALEPHQEKTQDLHTELYSVNQLWSQWPTNLLDCARHCTQLFPVTLSIRPWFDHRPDGCAGFGYNFLSSAKSCSQTIWGLSARPLNLALNLAIFRIKNPHISTLAFKVWFSDAVESSLTILYLCICINLNMATSAFALK